MSPYHRRLILVCCCRLLSRVWRVQRAGWWDGHRVESPRVCHVTFARVPVVFVPLDHLQVDTHTPPVVLLVLFFAIMHDS
jgi:hypothetical protein